MWIVGEASNLMGPSAYHAIKKGNEDGKAAKIITAVGAAVEVGTKFLENNKF